jgi:hypothetical protein
MPVLRRPVEPAALFGHGAMSDLSPLCAPKQTSADFYGFNEFTRDAAEQAALPVPPSGDVYEICEAQMPDFEVVN